MGEVRSRTRLDFVMELLGVSALKLSEGSGVSNSLISRWRKGTRVLTERSGFLRPLARELLSCDAEGKLDEVLVPYRMQGESAEEALCIYLVGQDESDLPPRFEAPSIPEQGEYVAHHRVLLGHRGFRKAALVMLDYLLTLPPNREVVVLCQGRYDWLVGDLVFVLQFIQKLQCVVKRGTTLTVINRRGYSIAETAAFAGPWLTAHLRGYIRSRYYDGELPVGDRFIASIKGYWCGYAIEDDTAEDGLYITLHTDPREIRRAQALCDAYRAESDPASQYGFLQDPCGKADTPRLWENAPLPRWPQPEAKTPTGTFYALCRTPSFGIMTRSEWDDLRGNDESPALPPYIFSEDEPFSLGSHRIILCKEDIREALAQTHTRSLPLSLLLHHDVFVTKEMLINQIKRLHDTMEAWEDFEVALVPRAAFTKLGLELICWQNSASVGWLQDGTESVFANDKATSGSFYGFIDYTWGKLQKGWKRKTTVARTLRKWIAGKGLDEQDPQGAKVRNWDILPKG